MFYEVNYIWIIDIFYKKSIENGFHYQHKNIFTKNKPKSYNILLFQTISLYSPNVYFFHIAMLSVDVSQVPYYLEHKKQRGIQIIKEYLVKIMDCHTDSLIDQFKKITGYNIFSIASYEYWPDVDGYPMVRINYLNDPQPRVYRKIEATLIHHIYANTDKYLEKQAALMIQADHDTAA